MKAFKTKENFSTPPYYFDQLEETILNETKRFGNASSFDVPTDYFAELESKILQENCASQKLGNVRKLWFTVSSVAACLLLISFVYFQIKDSSLKQAYIVDLQLHNADIDPNVEEAVYESLYRSYFADDDTKKSSNEITLDDLDQFYSENQLSSSR